MKTEKFCPKCKQVKSNNNFYKIYSRGMRLGPYCITCSAIESKKYKSTEKYKKWRKKYYYFARPRFARNDETLNFL